MKKLLLSIFLVCFSFYSAKAQYCVAGASTKDEYISNVTIGSINKTSSWGTLGYEDYTSESTNMPIGVYTSATITAFSYPGDQILIWVDWNHDNDFEDAGEAVYASSGSSFSSPHTSATFAPPEGAFIGSTRMRIRLNYTGYSGNTTPCGNATYGEVEDYTINVIAGLCTPPTTQATSFTPSAIANITMTVGWARGNGDNVMVVARSGSSVNSFPVFGTNYAANAAFKSGDQLGTGNYVVYNGIGTSVNLTGLNAGTKYYFAIIEYKTADKCYKTPGLAGNATTTGPCAAGSPGTSEYISNVAIGTINQGSGRGADGYEDYTSQITILPKGAFTSTTISVTSPAPWNQILIWVDWNNDGDFFDQDEDVYSSSASSDNFSSPHITANFAPPSGISTGIKTMRVRLNSNFIISNNTPCGISDYGEVEDYSINVTAELCTPPSTQASVFTSSLISDRSMTVGWTRGNGNAVIVVARTENAIFYGPVFGTTYTANAAFGSGTQIGTGNYVVYNGTGTSVTLTGLNTGTTYFYDIYEFSTSDKCYKAPSLTGNVTTTGPCAAGSPSTSNEYISNVSIGTINQLSGRGANGYQDYTSQTTDLEIGVNSAATVTVTNSDIWDKLFIWVDWNKDGDFTDPGEDVYESSGDFSSPHTTASFAPPLDATFGTTTMRIRLSNQFWGFNSSPCGNSGKGEVEDYSINVTAGCTLPSNQAITFTSTALAENSMTVGWTRGNGTAVLVVAKAGGAVSSSPQFSTTYSANAAIGSGTQIGTGNYVVYNGTGTSVNVTGLSPGTTYHYAVFEYNTEDKCYKTPGLAGNATTTGTPPCAPCSSTGSMADNTSITLVNFNTINNLTAKPAGYNDYTLISTTVNKNSSYNLNVNVNTDGPYTDYARAWIDWNQDCDFEDPGESYDLGTATNVTNGITTLAPLSITVPVTAITGSTRIRVSLNWNGYSVPCASDFWGEVEDYTLNVDIATGNNELLINTEKINVYPNPVSSELNIEFPGNNETLDFEILNSLGKVVYNGTVCEKTVVQTVGMAKGVYLIKFRSQHTFVIKKIIKG